MYAIRKVRNKECYKVVNITTGTVHSKCTSRKKAESQVKLLRALDHGYILKKR